jgi:hypothetical protein
VGTALDAAGTKAPAFDVLGLEFWAFETPGEAVVDWVGAFFALFARAGAESMLIFCSSLHQSHMFYHILNRISVLSKPSLNLNPLALSFNGSQKPWRRIRDPLSYMCNENVPKQEGSKTIDFFVYLDSWGEVPNKRAHFAVLQLQMALS